MKRITFLFALFFLLQNTSNLKAQVIHNLSDDLLINQEKIFQQFDESSDQKTCFYYDKIVSNLSPQLDGDYLLENLTRQVWNETSSSWVNDSLYTHSYNDENLADTIISLKWEDGYHWTYKRRSTYGYNTSGKLTSKGYAEMISGNWQDFFRYNYYYSGTNGNLQSIYGFEYLPPDWYHSSLTTYSWNTNNYVTKIITSRRNHSWPGNWYLDWKDELYYDSTNALIMKTGFDAYDDEWIYEINDLYAYDNIGNNNENIRQEWNSTDSIWINDYRYLYEYDVNNVLLSIIYQDWQQDSLDWENVWREIYTYTPQNKIATMFKETWSPETGWNNYVQRTFFYDLNYNWIEKITYLWDVTYWKNYYRHLATWLVPVSVWETLPYLESYYLSNNYPNPFNPSTKIKFEIPEPGFVSLKIFDVLGNEITTLVDEEKPAGEYEVEFDGKGLSSGMYFYTLRAGNYIETKKMVLIK